MGKQWLLSKVPDGGCHSTPKSSSTTNTKSAGKSRKRGGDKPTSSSSSFGGCMSAIFHLFDIQHHHFPFHQPSFISDSSINIPQEPNVILKGVEAPRNSLELEEQEHVAEEVASSSSSSTKVKQETNFNIPVGGIQIKTKRSRLMDDASSECSSSSPGTKTPSLVARLMGLDLLPENSSPRTSLSSPRPSSSSSHARPSNPLSKFSSHRISTNSLPATPREVDYHHRLSLQTSKENRRIYDENKSEYAKQIMQQVRENISRRVGADITNTVNRKEQRRDECLVLLKPKRRSPPPSVISDEGHVRAKEYETVPLSCSHRLKLLEIKNNLNFANSNSPKSSPLSSSTEVIKGPSSSLLSSTTKSPTLTKEEVQVVKQETPLKVQKCKKIASEKYDLRLKKKHQQEQPFVKKCNKKSTPLSKHLVNVNTAAKFISFKKDMAPPSSTATLSQKQVPLESITQLPSCQSRSYKETHKHSLQDNVSTNGNGVAAITTTTTGGRVSDHFEYISRILSHTGIEKTTLISVTHWYSPSHPLHPSIFNQLEKLIHPTAFDSSATRKLIFDVADELLVEILKPYISFKPWAAPRSNSVNSHRMNGSELIGKLCKKISSFPAADCQVLEDIDGVIEGDMRRCTRMVGEVAFEEEAEELVAEMERDMVDTLVNEMAGIIWHVGCRGSV